MHLRDGPSLVQLEPEHRGVFFVVVAARDVEVEDTPAPSRSLPCQESGENYVREGYDFSTYCIRINLAYLFV